MIYSAVLLSAAMINLPALPPGECFTTSFTQTRALPALQRPLVLHGRLRVERNGNLDWHIISPYQYRFFSRGETFTEVTPDGAERQVDPAQAPWLTGVQQLFGALLAGEGDALAAWFEPGTPRQVGTGWELALTPAHDAIASAVASMTITYDAHLQSVEIDEAGGGTTRIAFEVLHACSDEPVQ